MSSQTWGHGKVTARAATEGLVWVCGYTVAGVGVSLWLILPLDSMGMSLEWAASGHHLDARGCANWSCPSLDAELWLHFLLLAALKRVCPLSRPGSTVELALVVGVWASHLSAIG